MSIAGYVGAGIGVLIILLIYGSIYIMASEKKKKEKTGILFLAYEFISKKIEFWRREKCIRCGNPTAYKKKDPIMQRVGYKEGAGQLCSNCNDNIYPRAAAEM